MPSCSICGHPDRDAIEAGLVTGASVRGLARAHRVSSSALRRHRDAGHLPRTKVDQADSAKTTQAEDLLRRAGDYERIAASIVAGALRSDDPDPRLALAAIDRALAAVVAQGRLVPGKATAAGEVRVVFNVPLPSEVPPPIIDEDDLPSMGNGTR